MLFVEGFILTIAVLMGIATVALFVATSRISRPATRRSTYKMHVPNRVD